VLISLGLSSEMASGCCESVPVTVAERATPGIPGRSAGWIANRCPMPSPPESTLLTGVRGEALEGDAEGHVRRARPPDGETHLDVEVWWRRLVDPQYDGWKVPTRHRILGACLRCRLPAFAHQWSVVTAPIFLAGEAPVPPIVSTITNSSRWESL